MIISDAGSAGREFRERERTASPSQRDGIHLAARTHNAGTNLTLKPCPSISSKSSLRATLNPPSRWISCTNNVRRFDSLIKRGVVEPRQLAPPSESCVNLSPIAHLRMCVSRARSVYTTNINLSLSLSLSNEAEWVISQKYVYVKSVFTRESKTWDWSDQSTVRQGERRSRVVYN